MPPTIDPTLRYNAYAARRIVCEGISAIGAWRLRKWSVACNDANAPADRFADGVALVAGTLPPPSPTEGRPGVGFLIRHAGNGADYTVLCWWDRENEMPIRVAVRDHGDGSRWRPARESESVCVWDLSIIAAERDAWVATALSGVSLASSVDAYLSRAPTVGRD